MSRSRLCGCAIWLVVVASASTAQAQDDAFRAGLDARNDKKWQDVVTQMRRAIQANPQESTRKVRSGLAALVRQGGMEYLPHYFLGEAFFYLQDCAGAVDSWSRSELQGVLRARPDFVKVLQAGYVACEARGVLPPGKFDPLLQRTTTQITDANTLAATVSGLGKANMELWRPDMREQYDRATSEIQLARNHLAAAARSRAVREFTDASAAVDRARALLNGLSTSLAGAIEARESVQAQAKDLEQMLASAETLDRAIDGKKAWLTQPLSAARQSGRDGLTRARDRRADGLRATSGAALSEARTLAQDAATRLKQVLDELTRLEESSLDKRLAEALATAQQAFASVDGALATIDRLSKERPTLVWQELASERTAIERQVTTARRRLEAARKRESAQGVVEATLLASESRDRLNVIIAAFGPLTLADRGVHPALEYGARLFFAGQYQQAVSALTPAGGFSPGLQLELHIHLFRAAALYALYLGSRESDESLRTRALAEVAQCRQLDPAFEPDPRAFSPRFLSFFKAGGATSPAGPPQPAQPQ